MLLVQDEKAERSAACMYVASGTLNEPPELSGVAHLCEHLLFEGSKKFREEHHFAKFIKKGGGGRGAITTEDTTNYHFEVKNIELKKGLELFAHFFRQPLFPEEAIEREVNTID